MTRRGREQVVRHTEGLRTTKLSEVADILKYGVALNATSTSKFASHDSRRKTL
jgi:hypothetical protein